MRSNPYNRVPTQTLRGTLCGALGSVAGTLAWLVLGALSAVLYVPVWLWAQACDRFASPFDESRSIVWCTVILAGAVVSFVTVADMWPAVEHAAVRLVAYAGSR